MKKWVETHHLHQIIEYAWNSFFLKQEPVSLILIGINTEEPKEYQH